MAAFSASSFDADAYFKVRPRYTPEVFSILYAWHEQQQQRGGGPASWKSAVDIGVGPGQLAYPLQSRFQHVIGIDPSPQMLAQAKSLDAPVALNIPPAPNDHSIAFQEGTAENTGLPDQSVDLVTAGATAHWLDWYGEEGGAKVWREMARILRPRGTLSFIGYATCYARGLDRMNSEITNFMLDPDRLGKFFDTSNPKAPYMIGSSYYDLIPEPTGPKWESSLRIKLDVDTKLDTLTSEPIPLPAWVAEALGHHGTSKTSLPTPLSIRRPLKLRVALIRSASAYIKFLEAHPEQKALVAENKDKAFEWCEEARWAQARADAAKALAKDEASVSTEEAKSHIVSWDEEVELYFPLGIFLARRSDQ